MRVYAEITADVDPPTNGVSRQVLLHVAASDHSSGRGWDDERLVDRALAGSADLRVDNTTPPGSCRYDRNWNDSWQVSGFTPTDNLLARGLLVFEACVMAYGLETERQAARDGRMFPRRAHDIVLFDSWKARISDWRVRNKPRSSRAATATLKFSFDSRAPMFRHTTRWMPQYLWDGIDKVDRRAWNLSEPKEGDEAALAEAFDIEVDRLGFYLSLIGDRLDRGDVPTERMFAILDHARCLLDCADWQRKVEEMPNT